MPSSYTPAIATPVTPPNGGTGVTNNAASTLTISGNFGTTFTVSGATALTLPTSGTVATTATFASPPALGSGTPAAVTGTTVTATTQLVCQSNGSVGNLSLQLGPDGFGFLTSSSGAILRMYLGSTLQMQFQTNSITLLGNTAGNFIAGPLGGFAFNTTSSSIECGNANLLIFKPDGTERMRVAAALITAAVPFKLPSYLVSTLPSAATAGAGSLAFVTDYASTAILGLGLNVATAGGGGSGKVVVYSDGTNWIVI